MEQAHLDITHYRSLTHEEEMAIENAANRIVSSCTQINKFFMNKSGAEKEYGFSLYQGGIVPGDNLRVVDIDGVDTEACCGTHCDNTAEVGRIRLLKTNRISDGIVRLQYVAGERAIERLNEEDNVLYQISSVYNVPLNTIIPTVDRFFKSFKKYETLSNKQEQEILDLTVRCMVNIPEPRVYAISDKQQPSLYFSYLKTHA